MNEALVTLQPYFIAFITYVLPLIAIMLSVWSFIDSRATKKIQTRMDEIELKLKEHSLELIERENREAGDARVEARAYMVSRNDYRIKFWNSGKATAHEVDFIVPEGYTATIIKQNVPFRYLEPNKSFEEIFAVHNQTSPNFPIITIWKDRDGIEHRKEQMVCW